MDFGLSNDQREIQRTARELLAERARPERVREHAEAGTVDGALWRELCELGWPGIAIAERYGGQGLGRVELSILCEELGRCLAPVPFLPSVLAATLIGAAGSEEQRERWLPALASGAATGAIATSSGGVAELVVGANGAPSGGVAAGAVRAELAEPPPLGAGAAEPDADASTREGRGQVLVLVEDGRARVLDAADAELTRVESIDPTRPAARVSAAAGVGEALGGSTGANGGGADASSAEGALAAGIDRALIAIASELVGVCERALEMTVAYVKERRQFGVPVGAYQAVSHRCAQMLLDTERARSTAAFAAWSADADPERLAEAAAMAKAAASDAGLEVTAAAIQAHGGIGFTWEADVHWLYKRAQIDAALLGGAKRHRARLAAMLA